MTKPLFIARQSRHPHRLIGWIVARVMERETSRDNKPAIERLDPAPTDTILDLGAGHGRSLSLLARYAHRGAVIGVDPSEVMVRRARQRNKMAIAAGRVRVEQATIPALPLADASVDKAMTVHTVYFWDSVAEHFTAIARVLEPGGRFVIGFVPAEDAVTDGAVPVRGLSFPHSQRDRSAAREGWIADRQNPATGRSGEHSRLDCREQTD